MKRTRSSNDLIQVRPAKRARTQTTYMAPATKKAIKAEILRQLETKYSQQYSTASAVDWAGLAFQLHPDAAGYLDQYVVGNKITPVGIKLKYGLDLGDSNNMVTVAIIQWKGQTPSSGVPTGSQVFTHTSSIVAPLSCWSQTYKKDFKVLGVHTHSLDTYNPKKVGEFKISGKFMQPIYYKDQDPSVTVGGGVYFVAISDSSAATHPAMQFCSGFYYKDA